MDLITIIIGLFFLFLFKWGFRVLFIMVLLKLVGQMIENLKDKGEEIRKKFEGGEEE